MPLSIASSIQQVYAFLHLHARVDRDAPPDAGLCFGRPRVGPPGQAPGHPAILGCSRFRGQKQEKQDQTGTGTWFHPSTTRPAQEARHLHFGVVEVHVVTEQTLLLCGPR